MAHAIRGSILPLTLLRAATLPAQRSISLPTQDGGRLCADLYGKGTRAVVLAHGGRFLKESWRDQAQNLVSKGFHVLAFDFRGFGCSTGPGQQTSTRLLLTTTSSLP